jgi:hypothetical protein
MREIMANGSPTSADRPALAPEQALQGLEAASAFRKRGPAPVHLWNPPYCGEIDMRIAADGTWFYNDSPIGRLPLVQLFASILRRDDDRYVLVTPVERVGVKVDDAPFLAVEMMVETSVSGQRITFRTGVEDFVTIDSDHPLRFEPGAAEGLKPYALVRGGLWALVKRALFYDLVALGETRAHGGDDWFGIVSSGVFFPMVRAAEIEGL